MPGLAREGDSMSFFGADYNKRSIQWCQKNIPNVSFNHNQLATPLVFDENTFDLIYGISIFTHLPLDSHYQWYRELIRILKPGGILFLTVSSDGFQGKMTDTEKSEYDRGNLVVRAKTRVGHRIYVAFQLSSFMRSLFEGQQILEHFERGVENGKPQQDKWLIKRVTIQ